MADLKIRNLQKGFDGQAIIKGIDLDVRDREFVVFVGPSGCGKSTLLRLIAGLEEASGGSIALDGTDITDTPPAKRDLAMVFQTYALYPHMTVRRNLSFALDLAGVDKREVAARSTPPHASSNCKRCWSASRASSPAANGSGWRSAGRSCATRRYSSSTNRCPTSTPPCACRCAWNWRGCTRNWRRP